MRYSLATLIACIGLFFIFSGSVLRYRMLLSMSRFFHGGQVFDYETMRAENDALRTALLTVQSTTTPRAHDATLIFANVFAAYPFNGNSTVRVDKGEADGMRVGYPASFGGSVLAGQVSAVFKQHSVVRMVGSPDWNIPVRVGPHKIAGLLVGGPVPRISMLPLDKPIAVGDAIITASGDLPYGLTIGTVSSLAPDSTGGIFQEAIVRFSYDLHDIAELAFMVWTPD